MKLLLPLYGLSDSSKYWHATFAEQFRKKSGIQTVASDMPLLFRQARGHLTGLLASYVEDKEACGDSLFSQLTVGTRKRFEVKSRAYDNMHFSVVYIDRSHNSFNIHQRPYIDRLKPLPSDAKLVLLRQYRAQFTWLIHSRPDLRDVTGKLAQVTEKSLNISYVKQYNTTVRYLEDTRHLTIRICKLDPESLHVCAYSDASFSSNTDHSSQLGCSVLLSDKHDNACILQYDSYKCRRVARSVLCAETHAFSDAFYSAHAA